jgi:ribosomal subunit interface protein
VDRVDIVVKGRHTAVPERFRRHVQAKLAKLERLDPKAYRVDAELSREHNPRLSGIRERVELTFFSRGPVIRAEAAARDPYAALDAATAKLNERLRRAADRRGSHHIGSHHSGNHHSGNHRFAAVNPAVNPALTQSVASVVAEDDVSTTSSNGASAAGATSRPAEPAQVEQEPDGYDVPDSSPMVLREEVRQVEPMTLDDALSDMERVGHDFYLFLDLPTGMPSVVYRRCGYDYGVIRLGPSGNNSDAGTNVDDSSWPDVVTFGSRGPVTASRVSAWQA